MERDAQPDKIKVPETVVLNYRYISTGIVFGSETINVSIDFECPEAMPAETFELDISDYDFTSSTPNKLTFVPKSAARNCLVKYSI